VDISRREKLLRKAPFPYYIDSFFLARAIRKPFVLAHAVIKYLQLCYDNRQMAKFNITMKKRWAAPLTEASDTVPRPTGSLPSLRAVKALSIASTEFKH
jgi:hypothetical protein